MGQTLSEPVVDKVYSLNSTLLPPTPAPGFCILSLAHQRVLADASACAQSEI
jgi:hypothetical protein